MGTVDIKKELAAEQQKVLDEIAQKAKKKKKLMTDEVEGTYDSFFTKS